MYSRIASPRPWLVGAMLAVLVNGVGCDETVVPPPEPEVATMRLIFPSLNDTVFVTIDPWTVTSGPITISANTAFTAQFLKDDGTPETLVTDAEFRLDVTPANTGFVTFTRSGAFAGTLNRVAAGSTTIEFALFHLEAMHHEWGEGQNVPITVN
jgi:hypothetical protein